MDDQDQDSASGEGAAPTPPTDVTIDIPSGSLSSPLLVSVDIPPGPAESVMVPGLNNTSPDPKTAKSLAIVFSWGFLAFIVLIVSGVIYLRTENEEATTQKLLHDIFSQLLPVWTGFLGMILGYYFRNKDP